MAKLQEISRYCEEWLRVSLFDDACPNGLQVEGRGEVEKLASAVTATEESVEAAVAWGADLLLVHHGLFWRGEEPCATGARGRKLRRLLASDLSLLAYHLPLDAHEEVGNNWRAARELGWEGLVPFYPHKGIPLGVIGRFPPIERERLQGVLEEYYGHRATCAFGGSPLVERGALLSGSGWRALGAAATAGVDCLITGAYDLPAWDIAYEERINFYALGHASTERVGPRALGEALAQRFGLAHRFFDLYNPF